MQHFVGLVSFQRETSFAPSLFVDIRKRMGQSVFDVFHQTVIDAHDGEKEKHSAKLTTTSKTENQNNIESQPEGLPRV